MKTAIIALLLVISTQALAVTCTTRTEVDGVTYTYCY